MWELKSVRQADAQSHSLERLGLVRSSADFHRDAPPPEAAAHAVDVRRRERALRQTCALLAKELAFALAAQGRAVDVREIHRQAKVRLFKAQGDLSVRELERKARWLEQCLKAGRLLG